MPRRITNHRVAAALDALPPPPTKRVPQPLAVAFFAHSPALLRTLDDLLERLHGEYAQGRRLYHYDDVRPDGLLHHDEVEPALAKEAFLVALRSFGTETMASELTEIALPVVDRWRQTDPAFDPLFKQAKFMFGQRLEHKVFERALAPDARSDPASAVLNIFGVKAAFPEKYRDNAPLPQPAPPAASVTYGFPNPYLAARQQAQLPPPAPPEAAAVPNPPPAADTVL